MTSETPETDIMLDAASDPLAEEPAQTMPLLGGVVRPDGLPAAGDDSADTLSAPGALFGRGSLILLLVFTIAGGSLYLMRRSQLELVGETEPSESELRIDEALARIAAGHTDTTHLAADKPSDAEKIVSMFSTDTASHQVPLEYVQKNPFVMPEVEVSAKPKAAAPAKVDPRKQERDLLDRLTDEVRGYKLQTVMQGSRPLAIINGAIVKQGQRLGSFKLIAVEDRAVKLSDGNYRFTLRMED